MRLEKRYRTGIARVVEGGLSEVMRAANFGAWKHGLYSQREMEKLLRVCVGKNDKAYRAHVNSICLMQSDEASDSKRALSFFYRSSAHLMAAHSDGKLGDDFKSA